MDVGPWLRGLGLGQYERAFRDAEITAEVLPELTEADLRELGLPLGPRRAVLKAIRDLAALPTPALPVGAVAGPVVAPTVLVSSQAERRQLTVMFIDLVGSTALSGRLDPEDMRELLRAYQNVVAGEVTRFEGHVAKYMGDGVLAYFGWPRAHEDAAERAVRAGLAVAAAVSGIATPGGELLAARVGIATGSVVVGDLIGDEEARERAVVGETPNLAARLQGLAQPGAVVIAEGTHRLLGDLFTCRDLGPTELKGFAGSVYAFAVTGEGTAEGRFEAMHAAGLTPLVGREHELALLLERWERARGGEGQVVLLAGEAGIGKSRLVRALREHSVDERHTWLSQFCSPYHANTALYPIVGLLERLAGLRRGDPPERQLDQLEAMLVLAAEDLREAAPLFADLLAIPAAGRYPPLELSPQQRKERVFQALLDQLAGLAARGSVLTLYEDVHWADPTMLELLGRVIERVQRLPVLAVVTFRPEFVPPWAGHGHVTALSLSRLGRRQGVAMVERVTGGKALPAEVLEQVVARTDGVPLFVEELTKAILESGLLAEQDGRYELTGPLPPLAIPATLQDSLMARLDRLAAVKEVAQIAACIGREFSHGLLAAAGGLGNEELNDALERLVGAELVFRRGEGAEAGYAFKHALVRDAAYHSLLRSRRQQIHAKIAVVLEERFPGMAAATPELLARHYAGAGLTEQAVSYWRQAAELAIGRSANLEAIAHCEEAEAQLRMLPPSVQRAQAELEIQLAKGVAARAGKGYSAPEAEQVFLRACELCEELGDRVRLVHALRGLWGFYCVAGRWRQAKEVANQVDDVSRGLSDRVALSTRGYVTGTTLFYRGDPAGAVQRLNEGLHHCDEGDREAHILLSGHDASALIRGHLALPQWLLGLPEQAVRTSEKGLEIARHVAHPFSLAQVLALGALLRVLMKDWDMAAVIAAETHEVCTRHGLVTQESFGTIMAGIATAGRGDAVMGADSVRKGINALRRTGGECLVPIALVHLAQALGASGDHGAALEAANEALRMSRVNEELCWEAEALRVVAEVRWAAGDTDVAEVEAELKAAVAVARRQEAKALEVRAVTSLGRLWAEGGEPRKARDLLAPVYGWFTEGLDAPDLRDAKALLDRLQ